VKGAPITRLDQEQDQPGRELVKLLEAQSEVLSGLIECARRERACLINWDLRGVNELLVEKQDLASRLEMLEKKRSSLHEVPSKMAPGYRERVSGLMGLLFDKCREVQMLHDVIRGLMENGMMLVKKLLNHLEYYLPDGVPYQRTGTVQPEGRGRLIRRAV